ncbi:MAG: hypothetical protein AAB432_01075 [Patescibacteria group bacterium]
MKKIFKKMLEKKVINLLVVTFFIFLLITAPKLAFGQTNPDQSQGWTSKIFGSLFSIGAIYNVVPIMLFAIIGYLLATLTGLLFSLVNTIGGLTIHLQTLITANSFVTTGWAVVRDVANLGFVLVIIIMAVATIFRQEEYGYKKLLPKLIAAAILVNFSLTIAAVFIDFSQTLMNFFYARMGDSEAIFSVLSGLFSPQKLLDSVGGSSPNFSAITTFGYSAIMFAIAPWLITAFNVLAIFVLLALSFMLFLRFFNLSFLLIISPIVWLFWVIPGLSKHFTNWWSKFFEWIFFGPAVLFFIYLAATTMKTLNLTDPTGKSSFLASAQGLLAGVDPSIKIIFIPGLNMFLLGGFLIGGLVVAQKLSITGASGAMNLLGEAGKGIQSWAGSRAGRIATKPFRTDKGRDFVNNLQTFGQNLGFNVGNRRFSLAGIAAPIRAVGKNLKNATQSIDKQVDAAGAELKGLSIDEKSRRFISASEPEQVAIVKDIAVEAKEVDKAEQKAQEILNRAGTHLNAARQRLNNAQASGNQVDIDKAQEVFNKANDTAIDAGHEMSKATERKAKFDSAIKNLPNDMRSSLVNAGYNLLETDVRTNEYLNPLLTTNIKKPKMYIATIKDVTTGGRKQEYKPSGEK